MNFQNVEFLISAASPKDFPKTRLPEIAFAGKSNVGKSSVINRLLQRKNFARVGEKPGKTIHVNYFVIDKRCYLVDLPGYGFAKVSQKEKERWGKLMEDYFAANRIDLGVLIVDYRHPPTNNDIIMANWFIESGCPFVVVANKMDQPKDDLVTVCGRCCESGDMVIYDINIAKAQRGDIFAVYSTGGYNYSMSSNYNKVPRAPIVLVKDGQDTLIVKRQSYENMISNELIPDSLK